jgi:hypothetical protein
MDEKLIIIIQLFISIFIYLSAEQNSQRPITESAWIQKKKQTRVQKNYEKT